MAKFSEHRIVDDAGTTLGVAANPLVTTATLSGDINADINALDTNGLIGKPSGGDFTTAYLAATTITLGTYPDGTSVTHDDIISVVQIATGGTVTATYTRDDAAMAVAANILTVTGATFAASDSFVIYTNIPRFLGGAGVVTAQVQRTTHASDDPVTTALQIMDDWDESDRAKVNIVAGQVGVTAGAGAVAANTQRVTLASDDPAVVALQRMDGTAMQAMGTEDVAGADTYTTIITSVAAATHAIISLGGANDAVISFNGGTTDHFVMKANSVVTFDALDIAGATAVQGKNKTGGSNYANLNISIW